MKKALTLLAVAAMAAVAFVGCAKTYEADATLDTGTENYDFSGKTLVSTDIDYITKTVDVYTTGAVGTGTSTDTEIPYKQTVTTIVFNSEGTYTVTKVVSYLTDADGDYRDNYSVSGNTTTTTSYSCDDSAYEADQKITGRAGRTIKTDTYSGTWKAYTVQDSATDGQTYHYNLYETSKSSSGNIETAGTVTTIAALYTGGSTVSRNYAIMSTYADTTAEDADYPIAFSYNLKGYKADANGDDKDYIFINYAGYGYNYIVQ